MHPVLAAAAQSTTISFGTGLSFFNEKYTSALTKNLDQRGSDCEPAARVALTMYAPISITTCGPTSKARSVPNKKDQLLKRTRSLCRLFVESHV